MVSWWAIKYQTIQRESGLWCEVWLKWYVDRVTIKSLILNTASKNEIHSLFSRAYYLARPQMQHQIMRTISFDNWSNISQRLLFLSHNAEPLNSPAPIPWTSRRIRWHNMRWYTFLTHCIRNHISNCIWKKNTLRSSALCAKAVSTFHEKFPKNASDKNYDASQRRDTHSKMAFADSTDYSFDRGIRERVVMCAQEAHSWRFCERRTCALH